MRENFIYKNDSFYLVGIGGVSMSALAKILLRLKKRVGGCDRAENNFTAELINSGASIEIAGYGDVSAYDVVVYTDAVPENNMSLVEARLQNKVIISRGELLNELGGYFEYMIAISGCHGKTTCTSMIAHIFHTAEKKFCAHIGGEDISFSNAYLSGFNYFITEACEYKRNFLKLFPHTAVILNSDIDHLDCYSDKEQIEEAYFKFATNAKNVVRLYGDLPGAGGITFGFDDRANYYAKKIISKDGKYSFDTYEEGRLLGKVGLNVYGKHNVLNALAAIAVARNYFIDFESINSGLASFCGVKRRFENIGSYKGAECIADYAHHPNEIRAVLKTARALNCGKTYVIFQPHTYSRTKALFKDFVSVLSQVKHLLVYKTYAAREYYDDAGSALTLSQSIKRCSYGSSPDDIRTFLSEATRDDRILFIGAGDIYDIARKIVCG